MKPSPWIFPGIAVLITGGWIVSRKSTAAALEREITVMTERFRQAQAGEVEHSQRDAAASADKEKKVDWKDLSEMIVRSGEGDLSESRAMIRLQFQLLEMSAEELSAQLDAIAALDLDDSVRRQLQPIVLGPLGEKDPKAALDHFKDELGNDDPRLAGPLSWTLGTWADKEPAAAAAWLDHQVAEGRLDSKSLDGKSQSRFRLEESVVSSLLKTNPAAASARVAALPADQLTEFFNQPSLFPDGKDYDATNAKVVRDNLPADKVAGTIGGMASKLAGVGGLERVDSYITSIAATPAEKTAIVEMAMRCATLQDINPKAVAERLENAREWAAGHAPDAVDVATGRLLAQSHMLFDKSSEIALEFTERAGNDQVLATFLKTKGGIADEYRARFEELLEHIKDSALREEIRDLPQYRK